MSEKETLTAPQVARMCGVDPKTVHRWIQLGHFPGARKGMGKNSPFRIPVDEVEAFIERVSRDMKEQLFDQVIPDSVPRVGLQSRAGRRAAAAAMTEVLQQIERPRQGTLFALIVEDDADAAEVFEFTLVSAGFATHVVRSGDAALKWLGSMAPDVIVLDLQLPDVAGTEVLRRMRTDARLAKVPVIVATAYPELAEGVEGEADLVLVKPVRYSVLQDGAVELTGAE